MKKFASLLITTTLIAAPAFAGNPVVPPRVAILPPPVAAPDWSGFYAGGMISSANGTVDYANPNFNYNLADEALYGGFVGYNIQRGSFVFGAELGYTSGGLSPAGYPNETHEYFIDAKARAGYSFGRAMVYGFAGYTQSSYDNIIDVPKQMTGMNYGVGTDILFGDNMFGGVEYIFRDISGAGNTSQPAQTRNSKIGAIQLRFGWNF